MFDQLINVWSMKLWETHKNGNLYWNNYIKSSWPLSVCFFVALNWLTVKIIYLISSAAICVIRPLMGGKAPSDREQWFSEYFPWLQHFPSLLCVPCALMQFRLSKYLMPLPFGVSPLLSNPPPPKSATPFLHHLVCLMSQGSQTSHWQVIVCGIWSRTVIVNIWENIWLNKKQIKNKIYLCSEMCTS